MSVLRFQLRLSFLFFLLRFWFWHWSYNGWSQWGIQGRIQCWVQREEVQDSSTLITCGCRTSWRIETDWRIHIFTFLSADQCCPPHSCLLDLNHGQKPAPRLPAQLWSFLLPPKGHRNTMLIELALYVCKKCIMLKKSTKERKHANQQLCFDPFHS